MNLFLGHHFYGTGNLGDDWMLAGFLNVWRELDPHETHRLTCATVGDIDSQRRRFPEIIWLPFTTAARQHALREADVWLGLGSAAFQTDSGPWMLDHLVQELEWCQHLALPMYFLGVGVNNREALSDPRALRVLHAAQRVWTRDHLSTKWLEEVVPAGRVVEGADLAHLHFAESPPPAAAVDTAPMGWLVHFENQALCDPATLQEVITGMPSTRHHWLVQEVRALPGSERVNHAQLPPSLRHTVTLQVPDYAGLARAALSAPWPACHTVVSSRLHGAIWAAWSGARLLTVARNDKLTALAESLGCTHLPSLTSVPDLRGALEACQPVPMERLHALASLAQEACHCFFQEACAHAAAHPRPVPDTRPPLPIPPRPGILTRLQNRLRRLLQERRP